MTGMLLALTLLTQTPPAPAARPAPSAPPAGAPPAQTTPPTPPPADPGEAVPQRQGPIKRLEAFKPAPGVARAMRTEVEGDQHGPSADLAGGSADAAAQAETPPPAPPPPTPQSPAAPPPAAPAFAPAPAATPTLPVGVPLIFLLGMVFPMMVAGVFLTTRRPAGEPPSS